MNAMLTARETDVVRLLAKGCTYGKVAQLLGISEHTVATHIKNLYRKLDVHTAAGAVFRAMQLQGEAVMLSAEQPRSL
jgi:DNA-binding CsgD family transcriptional regulator